MSYYEEPQRTRRYVREERREERIDPRYADEGYLKVHQTREIIPRARENSELSIEEVRRDFPPPGYRDSRRTRSAEPGYYDDPRYDDRDRYYDREYDRRSRKAGSLVYAEEERSRKRVINQQEKILAAVAGAALAFGGKELYDRKEAKEHRGEVERNYLTSAALGAAGALAGYQGAEYYGKRKEKEEDKSTYVMHRGRDGRVTEYYSDEEGDREKKGHKSFLENALAASGLGVAVKALTGASGGDDRRSDTRSRRGSPDSRSSRSKSRGPGNEAASKMQKAAMASLIAGATEAFRVAKEPGGWKGEKTKRIITAAAGAATIDAAQGGEKQSKLGLAESVIGGLVGNRVINGSKRNIEEDRRTGRSRSRSRARSDGGGGGPGLAALATAGLGAFGAKKAIENFRSRSRGRSADSYDSRASSRDGRDKPRARSRSRSVVDSARKRLAKIGIGSNPEEKEREKYGRDDYYDDDRSSRRGGVTRRYSDEYDDGYDRGSTRGGRDAYDDDRSSYTSRRRDRSRRRGGKSDASSESDLGDSDDDAKRARKMRGKQVITTGLAAVATIHAAHGVYQSMEKRNSRQKAVREGRLSPEEAKKLKTKALVQDAASVGIAALGIKGAWSELKEAKEMTHECKEFQHEKEIRHQKRLERQKRLTDGSGGGRRSRADDWNHSGSPRGERYDYGSTYYDDNPYSAGRLPAPPVGYDDRRYRD
ncbi:hypothetical protein BDP55DRAFT_726575 [Colletotrichum godetiae]|uniref:DUF3824 domain-containing protein n=1 Tax=Colletotrichum godetiae TaxID=1209918 RepID=A0AAJ0EUZ2_9PEZI|nr:uncharacterized protein BDP55DRAFT_726575 [Colletotrichum godetiae]KAK1688179.1 hypothetical protein BDP55DRAFT_726575 [Colletotrichum godetiae]